MRVIAGIHRGRRLQGPQGFRLRPTSDRVKEALFSIIGDRVQGACVLDLYAGTGAIGIEALSRGARHVTFVDDDPAALRVLRSNLQRCEVTKHITIHACRVDQFLRRREIWGGPYDFAFADPPYAKEDEGRELAELMSHELMTTNPVAVLEHPVKMAAPKRWGSMQVIRQYRYGDTALSLFQAQEEPAHAQ